MSDKTEREQTEARSSLLGWPSPANDSPSHHENSSSTPHRSRSNLCSCRSQTVSQEPRRSSESTVLTSVLPWRNDDDPPPYSSVVNGDHLSWSRILPPEPPYNEPGGSSRNNRTRSITRPIVSIPLTSYGIFKIEPPRHSFASSRTPDETENMETGPIAKSTGLARKYGAILIGATVVIFLMSLSLLVRFVIEKSFIKG